MKILFVHERFGSLAGAETNLYITARELSQRGHRVGFLHGPATGKGEEDWRLIFPQRYPLGGRRSVDQAILEFDPDLIYVHKLAELEVLEQLLLCRRTSVRMVHDHDIYCMRSYKYNYFTRKICTRPASWRCLLPCMAFVVRNTEGSWPVRWVSYKDKKREIRLNHRFDRMLVVTEYMREELLRNGFQAERISLMPPVPLPGESGLRSDFGGRNLILYVGQIVRGKGVDVLLRALAQVKEPFECVILGDGRQRSQCERLSEQLGLSQRVRFAGFVPQEQLKEYFRQASMVAISSVWPEPIATVGLEVMRYALPVVAFDAGGIRDWLIDGHNGFLVEWMNTALYARRIDELMADKEKARQMGQAGFQLVSERYDFAQYIQDLERLFGDLVAAGG